MKWLAYLFMVTLCSCSVTRVQYAPIQKIIITEKLPNSVELLHFKPQKAALCIGLIRTDGNGFASHDDGVSEAKKKAGLLGADFILVEKSGTETSTYYNPGYSTYQSNGSAYLSGNNSSIYGSASQNAVGYSVGPSISTINFPWSMFSAWVYRPSFTGIEYDENYIVTGFHFKSTADTAGMKIGDKILGIDGFDVKDEELAQHLMEVMPGTDMTYSISREDKRIDIIVKSIKN